MFMHHGLSLIPTLAMAFGLALLFGFLAVKARLPPLVGYLLAGILLGPNSPGYVADAALAAELSEIGVMLLMFGVGLHFSLEELLSVKGIAVPGAILQMATATIMGALLAFAWGWPLGSGLVFGLALSVASTVVLLKALEGRGILKSINGRIAVGWLVVEDLVMVLVLVLLPPLAPILGGKSDHAASAGELAAALGLTLGKVALFVALMLVVGRRLFPWILWQVARTGSRELFTLGVTAAAVGIAFGSASLFGVSMALGAFFAGMVLRESRLSYRAAAESLPLRDAFSVLFFVAVGMLFEPRILWEHPIKVVCVLAVIILGKSWAATGIVLLRKYPLTTALTVSAGLAQIGEFSFILAGLGFSLGLLPPEAASFILAGAILSIALNPLIFHGIEPIRNWLEAHAPHARGLAGRNDPLAMLPSEVEPEHVSGHLVLVGYGRVGERVGQALLAQGVPFVVAEQNREIVEKLRAAGIKAVFGEASEAAVLVQAHIARAAMLVIAAPDTVHVLKMLETARALNPGIATVVRTHTDEDGARLVKERVDRVFMGEDELAHSITAYVLEARKPAPG